MVVFVSLINPKVAYITLTILVFWSFLYYSLLPLWHFATQP